MANHPKEFLTAKEVHEATGASLRCLQYWDEKKVVSPSKKANGTGTRRLYTREDLVLVSIVKRMRDQKISLERIKQHMRTIKRTIGGALAEGRIPQLRLDRKHPLLLIPRGSGVEQIEQIVDALSEGQFVLAIALDPLRAQIDRRLPKHGLRGVGRMSVLAGG